MYKYVRFMSIGGKVEWDSIKDDDDLHNRFLKELSQDERDNVLMGLSEVGHFSKLEYDVIVRVA